MNTKIYSRMLKVHNTGFEFNRSIQSRLHTAYASQERRHGLTKHDDLTLAQLTKLVLEDYMYCPVCGITFNTYTRKNEEGYDWEISHIDPEGHLTLSNVQLTHHACNSAQYKDVIDFKAVCDEYGFICYLDIVRVMLKRGAISPKDKTYKNYINLLKKIDNGSRGN